MSEHAQNLDRLDAEAKEHAARMRPEVIERNRRLAKGYMPDPGSRLAADDEAVPGMWVSQMARISLATGSHHLHSTIHHLVEFGPALWSPQSLLRTAMWGGAQAVWLLSPEDLDVRVERAKRVHYYSQDNYQKWLNTFDDPAAPTTPDPDAWQRANATVGANLKALGRQPRVDQTQVVKDVALMVFRGQLDAVVDCEQGWRAMGAVAHALPWELGTRATSEVLLRTATTRTERTTARWAEAAADLGYAYEFLKRGWLLFDMHSVAPSQSFD